MQYNHMPKFNLQIFTVVQFGFLVSRGRCLIYKRFLPKSYETCPHLWWQPLLIAMSVVHPNFQGELKDKFCL